MMKELAGIDAPAVEAWIVTNTQSLHAPFTWTRLEGGHSNLTYRIEDAAGHKAVVRRPPEGELLPKAHDMGREYAIIRALYPTAVPVPKPLGYCASAAITGAHFYVMGEVAGKAMYTVDDVNACIPQSARATTAMSFMDVLAALHAIKPDAVGLDGLGRQDGYIARQLAIWYGSWQASKEAARIDASVIHALHEQLAAAIPAQGSARVVHGDYGLHNCLIGADHRIAAVLDWEISTLGDPLADLAYAVNSWTEPGDPIMPKTDAPTLAGGFPSRATLLERYASQSGRALDDIGYYTAFNYFKSACIIHGVYARYRKGQKAIAADQLTALRLRVEKAVALCEVARDAAAL